MKIIENHWQSFRERVIPADAPEVQIVESRRAFYAGAIIVFGEVNRVNGMSEDAGCAHMSSLDDEIKQYARDLMDGKA